MHTLKLLPLLLFASLISQPVSAQYKVGDRLVVIRQAEIKVGTTVLQILGRGQDVRVDAVIGDRLWVKNLSTGWIDKQTVRLPAAAIDVFNEQIRWNPLDAGAYYAAGITRVDLNDLDIAIRDFSEAVRLDPRQSCAYNGRGICFAKKGETDKAIADYTQAILLDPTGTTLTFVNRAMVWNARGEHAKAISDATQAIRMTPGYVGAYSVRAQASAAIKQFDKAIADCEEIRKISTKGLSGYNDVAWLLATSPDVNVRDGNKAVEFVTKASELTNWLDGGILDTQAAAFAEVGDFDQAVKWEMKAIEISADRDRTELESRLSLFESQTPFRE